MRIQNQSRLADPKWTRPYISKEQWCNLLKKQRKREERASAPALAALTRAVLVDSDLEDQISWFHLVDFNW